MWASLEFLYVVIQVINKMLVPVWVKKRKKKEGQNHLVYYVCIFSDSFCGNLCLPILPVHSHSYLLSNTEIMIQ